MRTSSRDEYWLHPLDATKIWHKSGISLSDVPTTVAYGIDIKMLKEFYYRGYFITPDLRTFQGFSKPFFAGLVAFTEEAADYAESVLGCGWHRERKPGTVYISRAMYDPLDLMAKLRDAPLIKDPNTADFAGHLSILFPKTFVSKIYDPDSNDIEHQLQQDMLGIDAEGEDL